MAIVAIKDQRSLSTTPRGGSCERRGIFVDRNTVQRDAMRGIFASSRRQGTHSSLLMSLDAEHAAAHRNGIALHGGSVDRVCGLAR